MKQEFNISDVVSRSGCFDLQFRKDTRKERTGSPTYYRWKIQFIITVSKEALPTLKKIQKILNSGSISEAPHQVRFSVQNVQEIFESVVPYFEKHALTSERKRDFELWKKAAEIIYQNKGKTLATWKKHDLMSLLHIHQSIAKYKQNPRKAKWMEMAKTLAKGA